MSGHSKWSTIKRDKAINDSKRSKIFSKVSRAITVAAKIGGGDPAANASLRLAIEKAKEARMPKDNIERAVKKGTGQGSESAEFYDQVYEAYGPNGEAFYIKILTDNKNRTAAEIRNLFSKYGGSLGGPGSTAYIFSPDPENPSFLVDIQDDSQTNALKRILDGLDDNDDVQDTFFNFELDDDENEIDKEEER
jgi:YebC/PmpR family DNA-binding regulatory protein